MTLRHTRPLILSTIAIYEPECGDPECGDCKARRKWEAALAEVDLAEAVIKAARAVRSESEARSPFVGYAKVGALVDALAALDAAEKEQD